MDHAYSILMLLFAAALLLYALILGLSGDVQMIPRHYAAEMPNKKAYARKVAKIVALVALAPILSALCAYFHQILAFVVLILGTVFFIWVGVKITNNE